MEEAICGGVKTWQPSSILSNERQAIKRQAAQNGCMYARPRGATICAPTPQTTLPPPAPLLLLVTGALTAAAKFISGQERFPGPEVSLQSALWGEPAPSKAWVCVCVWGMAWGVGGARWGGVGLRKLKDMALFPISLGDNKKGMLEKGKQREESTKTKARARSV